MKRVIKKVLIILVIFIIVFEFSFSNTSFAAGLNLEKTVNSITNLSGGIVSIVWWQPRLILVGLTVFINTTLGGVIKSGNTTSTTGTNDGSFMLTPFDIFFNEYDLLGINFFDIDDSYSNFVLELRQTVAVWFYAMRTIASAILLLILIYVGIRMAISSVAEDKAKYKKMLIDWCCSLALIFLLQYIAIAVIYLNNSIVDALRDIFTNSNSVNIKQMMNSFLSNAVIGIGITSMISAAVLVIITAQSFLYFVAYFKRVVTVGFLIIISPLISITYSIDKMGDGKAQALNNWLKEFIYTILIQPFHCVIYIAFVNTAFKLVQKASMLNNLSEIFSKVTDLNQVAGGVLVIACLLFINSAEKVVRKIFGFTNGDGKTSLAAGALMAGAAVGTIAKAGKAAATGINGAKSFGKNLGSAIKKDGIKFKNGAGGKIADKLKGGAGKLSNKMSNKMSNKFPNISDKLGNMKDSSGKMMDSIKNSQFANAAKDTISGAKTLAGKFKEKVNNAKDKYNRSGLKNHVQRARLMARKNTGMAVGAMAALMSVAAGGDIMSAGAYGAAAKKATNDFFSGTQGAIADRTAESNQRLDDAEYKELSESLDNTKKTLEESGLSADATAEDVDKYGEEKLKSSKNKKEKLNEEAEKAGKALEDAQNELQRAEEAKANAKSKRQRVAAQKRIDEAKKDVENRTQAKEAAEKGAENANKQYEEEAAEVNKECENLKNIISKRDDLQSKVDNFDTNEAKQARMYARQYGPKKSDIEKARNEMMKLIMDFERKNNRVSDESQVSLLTGEEMEGIGRKTNYVTQKLDYAALKFGSLKNYEHVTDYSRDVLGSVGIKNDVNNKSKEYEMLLEACNKYMILQDRKNVAENGFGANSSYNGDSEELSRNMARTVRNQNPRKKH